LKISWPDKSYIECTRSDNPGKIIITIGARDHLEPLKKVLNSVELTEEEFKRLIANVQ
jgi:hypothetical protein